MMKLHMLYIFLLNAETRYPINSLFQADSAALTGFTEATKVVDVSPPIIPTEPSY
jgi:hypothetical protein